MRRLLLSLVLLHVLGPPAVWATEFLFGTPTKLGGPVNSSISEYGSSISADDLSLFITRGNNFPVSSAGFDNDIYVSKRPSVNEPWGTPERLSTSVNSDATEGFPSITADGLSLFFADRWSIWGQPRQDGFGGGDLWMSLRETTDSPWSDAINLGETINSQYQETDASISADGLTLFFASNRPGGSGDYDIWFSTRDSRDAAWAEPQNLHAVNSSAVDTSPGVSPDGLSLIFSTRREGRQFSNLWVSTRDGVDEPWKDPVSLGFINDPNEYPGAGDNVDIAPRLSADGSTLYFSSWSPGNEFEIFSVPMLPFEGVSVRPGGDAYGQNFDEALGVDGPMGGGSAGTPLPTGWTTTDSGVVFENTVTQRFPAGARISHLSTPTFNAGAIDNPDRALSIGVTDDSEQPMLQLLAEVVGTDATAFQLEFDIEAWDADRTAEIPGEAAFDVTVDVDSGEGFIPLVDLGTVSTGTILDPGDFSMLDGNLEENRLSYDSGMQPAMIPAGSMMRIRWTVPADSASLGWIYGLDNVSVRLHPIPEPSGLVLLLTAVAVGTVSYRSLCTRGVVAEPRR